METSTVAEEAPRAGIPWTKVAIGIAALAAVIAIGRSAGDQVQAFAQWVDGLGVWGPIVFIVGYAIAVVAFVPASLLTLAAGAVFGLGPGTAYVIVAATTGASLAFLVSRYLARGAIERRLDGNARFAAIDRAVGNQGRRIVFLLRLSPVFPFNLLNYALGLTRVRFVDYFIASLGMLPGTFLYVYSGKAVGDVAALAGGVAPERGASEYVLLGVGLLATAIVTILVTRIARRALDEAHVAPEPTDDSTASA